VEFISVAAPELRTPLTAILLQLERLEQLSSQKSGDDAQRLHQSASRAVGGAHRLAALVDGLLDASRLPHGRLELKLETLDWCKPLATYWRRSLTLPSEQNAKSCFTPGPRSNAAAIRYGSGKCSRICFPTRSSTAKESRTIFRSKLGKPLLTSRSAITASAFAPKIADRIFERFGRAGPIAHYGGFGFGLYLARAVIEAHGGAIRFESKPNEGCTFMFEVAASIEVQLDSERLRKRASLP
jgi:signal transduction histidine kinase